MESQLFRALFLRQLTTNLSAVIPGLTGDPVFRGVRDGSDISRRTGSPVEPGMTVFAVSRETKKLHHRREASVGYYGDRLLR